MVRSPEHVPSGWPASPLDAARSAFTWLTSGPNPVCVDGRLFDHLPDREVPVDELRDRLLHRSCPRVVWDQAWRHVLPRARREGGTWTVVAAGLALPMLTTQATRLTTSFQGDPSDIHAEVLHGFLHALNSVDLRADRITVRLRWAAYRAGHRALTQALDEPTPTRPGFHPQEPQAPAGHPDLVLARAVRKGVISQIEAAIIAQTRLDEVAMVDWARQHGLEHEAVAKARRRAELRLAAWLAGEMAESDPDPTGDAALAQLNSHEKPQDRLSKTEIEPGLQGCGDSVPQADPATRRRGGGQ